MAAEQERRSRRRDDTNALRIRAEQTASKIADDWPDVSRALRNTEHPDRLLWALRAGTDLAEGRTHDSLRAFVQSHANDTKARDDVHHLPRWVSTTRHSSHSAWPATLHRA